MIPGQLVLLGPFISLAATVVVLMMVTSIQRRHRVTAILTLTGLAIALALLCRAMPSSRDVAPMLVVDDYARFYIGLILAATAAVALLSIGYLDRLAEQAEEYYMLLLLAALGASVLVSAVHFISLFLGLELLSVSLYALIAYSRSREQSIEAGVKYLVLAAASAAFLLFGMALVYAEVGSMTFSQAVAPTAADGRLVWLVGMGLIVVGFGFKLALVPFHLWTPDVYEGAPAPATALVATVSKGAMLAALFRLFSAVDGRGHHGLLLVFTMLAIASMVGGNLLALLQPNVKRMLAYSSIAHLGYLMVAFLAGGALAATATAFYLSAYVVMMIGAFGVIGVLSTGEHDADRLEDYRGLAARRPWLAVVFMAMLLSLAGIPVTAGFVGKFYVTVAAGSQALWAPLVVMMITSGIGLFYYLRVIVAMFMEPMAAGTRVGEEPVPMVTGLTLVGLTMVLVWLGVYPGPLIALIRAAVAG